MADQVYVVDPATRNLTVVEAVPFKAIGVRERRDLEEWVVANPAVLGEELFVLTSEFDRFDKSNRRLDVLAIDKAGALVVIELKLDLAHSYADQQALRYAALCSTMTMDDAIEAYTNYDGCSREEATQTITEFLEADELPEFDDRPRIILAAGSLDDQELTSTVLWLRSFGVDITCVELTPFKLPSTGTLMLVPKTIIPLPEAREYLVRVQQKEAVKVRRTKTSALYASLWREIADLFESYGTSFKPKPRSAFMQIAIGHSKMHYEWLPLRGQRLLRIALHFEDGDQKINLARIDAIKREKAQIAAGEKCEFAVEPWGRKWATAEFRLPYDEPMRPERVAPEAARLMKVLVERTYPIIDPIIKGTTKS